MSSSNEPLDLRVRTRQYALRIIHLYVSLPKTGAAPILGKQLLRSGTSVGAHYAEASHAKSKADFTNKIDGALQELEETVYWMELLSDSGIVKATKLRDLLTESKELTAIFVSMLKKTRPLIH
jgi:four helix bundle protein